MNENRISITKLIKSKAADEDEKGKTVFNKIKECKADKECKLIILDFEGIELVNTAFLNDAIGKLYDKKEFDLNDYKVRVINMDKTMLDLLKETVGVAREKYAVSSVSDE